ncbi:MAG TPA: peptide chain release factor N(5)-glutamine methyltransferase [Steroidobacteraceae bacterium]|jgi:release factor glutamine methyltransferase
MSKRGNVTDPAGPSVRALLERGVALLANSSTSARLDAELLLACALGRPRSHLAAHDDEPIENSRQGYYQALLARRAQGEPLAYITGEREFWSLPLVVNGDVLIPRPETELAVERCLALRDAAPALIADLGTGSGAIALALARERPRWRVVATDRSAESLAVARDNATRCGVGAVEFRLGRWFEPLPEQCFDLIVSNPPYIAEHDPALAQLRYEPAMALVAGATGMEALRDIVAQASGHLQPGGWLVLEHGINQAAELSVALVNAGFTRVRCHADLTGRDRVTEAQRP